MQKILSAMLFFPSITFNVLPVEIFPWAFLKSLVLRIRLNVSDISVLLILCFGFLLGALNHGPSASIQTFASYINPLLIFMILNKVSPSYCIALYPLVKKIFFGLLFLGICQFLGLLNLFQFLFDFLTPRGGAGVFGGGGRGVSLLSTEPSRAGVEIVFIYALLVSMSQKTKCLIRGSISQDFLLLIFLTFVIGSFTALFFGLVFIAARRPALIVPIITLGVVILSIYFDGSRVTQFLFTLAGQGGITEFIKTVTSAAGFRFISVISAYVYAANNLVGYGIGAWSYEAINSYLLAEYAVDDITFFKYHHDGVFVNLKPTAFMALVALELGLIPLGVLAGYLLLRVRHLFSSLWSANMALGAIFLLYIFGVGAVGNPVPWVCAALAISSSRISQEERP